MISVKNWNVLWGQRLAGPSTHISYLTHKNVRVWPEENFRVFDKMTNKLDDERSNLINKSRKKNSKWDQVL